MNEKGRKAQRSFPCPKCRHPITRVIVSCDAEGVMVRRRVCQGCGHKLYTAQEPEYLVNEDYIYWHQGRPYIALEEAA